jgi:DNA modification methylase
MECRALSYQLVIGDCLDKLKDLADDSIDAIVTDPPYGLSFMGKKWDYDVPAVEVWRECLRVLKPGGHLLAFAGTRTQHRMAVNIEDAGFEIRDMIAWVYGSGFPKSLDVSKAIDKRRDDTNAIHTVVRWLESKRQAAGVSRQDVERHFGTQNIGQALFTITPGSSSRVATWEQWQELKSLFGFDDSMDAEVWRLNGRKGKPGEAWESRPITGIHGQSTAQQVWMQNYSDHVALPPKERRDIAATDAARQWQGWGTALKPALEPITVARKPLVGTVAANVLEHGTGAINVDGCRVEGVPPMRPQPKLGVRERVAYGFGTGTGRNGEVSQAPGRWPANLIHDGSDEVVGLFPVTTQAGSAVRNNKRNPYGNERTWSVSETPAQQTAGYTDSGSAARFFYCAKASKADRNSGGVNCNHPTVKPTDLMRYLCRLVTPPDGTVLDPFMGSGSTGKAAMLEGFKFVGIEREPEYADIAKARIEAAVKSVKQGELL